MDWQAVKIPKSIWVKGQEYTIAKSSELDEDIEGNTCNITKHINISTTSKDDELKRCLLHEIGHAIQYETGISQALSTEMQEVVTENFANVIIDIFHVRFK